MTGPVAAAQRGWYVFPLKYKTKAGHLWPHWAADASCNVGEVAAEFAGRDLNYGIHCGKSGLVVLDEDRPGALQRYAAEHGHVIPSTYQVSTGKGVHFYFDAPPGWANGNRAGALAAYGIDVRSGNGYVLGAGSVHPNGEPYKAENPDAPTVLLPSWAADAITGMDELFATLEAPFDLPDYIPAGKRDEILFRYACSLRGKGTKIADAGRLMQAAWKRCEQPSGNLYSLESAIGKLDQAWDYAYDAHGPKTDNEEERAALDLAKEIARQRRIRDAKQHLDDEATTAAFREPPSRLTLTEELSIPDEPITYLIEHLLPTGSNGLLTAQYKTGKTTLVNHLARSLADSESFLGRHPVAKLAGRVALFNYEVDERQFRIWLREVGVANTDAVSVLNLRGFRLPVLTKAVEDWIVAWLETRNVQVWIVDPFARAFVGSGVSENDNTQVGAFLDALDVIKTRAGVSELILPTHTGREHFEEGDERARGATRLDDWADVRWMLTKDDHEQRYFSATGRDVEVGETALKI